MTDAAPARRKRGPYAKSRQTQRRILDAALEVFAENGYRSGSLADVADRVGMSEAGLLHHFPNKGALLIALLEHRDAQASEQFSPEESDTPRRMAEAFPKLVAHNSTQPGIIEFYTVLAGEATSADHPAHAYFVDRYSSLINQFEAMFSDLNAIGELKPEVKPSTAAKLLAATMDGLQIQFLLDSENVDMPTEVRNLLNLVLVTPLPA